MSEASKKSDELSADAVVMRRVPRRPNHSQLIHGTDRYRATSFAIRAKEDEIGSSVSWIRFTTPIQCAEIGAATSGYQREDFQIAIIRVRDVKALKLKVVACATPEDKGHCEIREGEQPFSNGVWSRLAKRTLLLTEQEMQAIKTDSDAAKLISQYHPAPPA